MINKKRKLPFISSIAFFLPSSNKGSTNVEKRYPVDDATPKRIKNIDPRIYVIFFFFLGKVSN